MVKESDVLYIGVDAASGDKKGDLSCISVVSEDRVLLVAYGITPSSAFDNIIDPLISMGVDLRDILNIKSGIDKRGSTVYTIPVLKDFTQKCFRKCEISGCDMQEKHCGNNEFPPMTKCTRCQFWFTNLEKNEGRKVMIDETTNFRWSTRF